MHRGRIMIDCCWGLKGSLNEYELDLLRQRSVGARHQKARRGKLLISAPVGYVKSEDNRLEKNRTGACRRQSRWCSGNLWNSARCARLCYGFWNMSCNYRRITLAES